MKCYITNNSPYARKVRVVAFETGLYDEVEWKTITREERGDIQNFNPLGKVPVAILNAGDIVCDSPVICAYVDKLTGSRDLIPKSEPKRWHVLTLEALGDALEDLIAHLMPVGVVDLLEVVEVEAEQHQRLLLSLRLAQLLLGGLFEEGSVVEPREGVSGRLMMKASVLQGDGGLSRDSLKEVKIGLLQGLHQGGAV